MCDASLKDTKKSDMLKETLPPPLTEDKTPGKERLYSALNPDQDSSRKGPTQPKMGGSPTFQGSRAEQPD